MLLVVTPLNFSGRNTGGRHSQFLRVNFFQCLTLRPLRCLYTISLRFAATQFFKARRPVRNWRNFVRRQRNVHMRERIWPKDTQFNADSDGRPYRIYFHQSQARRAPAGEPFDLFDWNSNVEDSLAADFKMSNVVSLTQQCYIARSQQNVVVQMWREKIGSSNKTPTKRRDHDIPLHVAFPGNAGRHRRPAAPLIAKSP